MTIRSFQLLLVAGLISYIASLVKDHRLSPAFGIYVIELAFKAHATWFHKVLGSRRLELVSRGRSFLKEAIFALMPWRTAALLCEAVPPEGDIPLPVHLCAATSACLVGLLVCREAMYACAVVHAMSHGIVEMTYTSKSSIFGDG